MKYRKALLIALIISQLIVLMVIAEDVTYVMPYNVQATSKVLKVEKSVSFRFNINCDFNSLKISASNMGNNKGSMTIRLYKWDTTFENTINSQVIASKEYIDFSNRCELELNCGKQVKGEYLIHIDNTVENVGILIVSKDSKSVGLLYESGHEYNGDLKVAVSVSGKTSDCFNPIRSAFDYSYTVTTPEKYEYPEEHILNKSKVMPDTWFVTDGLGRKVVNTEMSKKKVQKRYVAISYWSWHCDKSKHLEPRNNTEIMQLFPEAKNDYNHSVWQTVQKPVFFWNEPLYGFYTTEDEWVIRKQAELLADAGVDVIFLDNTNGTELWKDGYRTLFKVFAEARRDGVKAPCISFTMHFANNNKETVYQLKELYMDIFRQDKYRELWFYWDDKPMIMAHPDTLSDADPIEKEIKEFFTFRGPIAKSSGVSDNINVWGWLDTYPQRLYYDNDGNLEMTTVGIAINWNENGMTAMNGKNVMGRTYTNKNGYDTRENAVMYGAFFEEQFEYAISKDPELIFITGWNEWTAGRYDVWPKGHGVNEVTNAFPDEFDNNNSRDIEPTVGELKDHYYYQMVDFIRKYKGINKSPRVSDEKSIDIKGSAAQWDDVMPEFLSYRGNTGHRDSEGYVTKYYKNDTGRNDIVLSKVARDNEFIFFMVKTKNDLTSESDDNWMRLFIDVNDSENNWEGYDYIINRASPENGKALLEESNGGWTWKKVLDIEYSVQGNVLQLKVPKSALGISTDDFNFNFKWSDNMQNDGEIMDFYQYGDTAPGGRFMYHYSTKNTKKDASGNNIVIILSIVLVLLVSAFITLIIVFVRKSKFKGDL